MMHPNTKQASFQEKAISKAELAFLFLATVFMASLVLTNIIAGKYFVLLGLPMSCSTLVYPFTFLVTDLVSEVYGVRRAKMLVFIGFIVNIVTTGLVWIANKLPIDAHSPIDQPTFGQTLGLLPGLVLGSMVAYLIAQFVDVQVFEYLRKVFNQKHLWIRNNGSTLISQFLDTMIVITVSLVIWPMIDGNPGTQPISWQLWKKLFMGQYLFKGMLALLDTPFVYLGIYFMKRSLGLERN